MLRHHFSLLLSAAALCVTGCASYREQPVDLAAIDAAWRARHQQQQTLTTFAFDLHERGASVPARIDLADGLDLAEAEVVTLMWNPTLRQARAAAGISAAEAEQAGRLADPELSLDALHALEAAANPWKLAGALSVTLPLSGRLGLERARAQQIAASQREALLAQEWSTLAVLREAWITWSAVTVEAVQAAALRDDLAALVPHAERLRNAGEISQVAARAVQIAYQRAVLSQRELAAEAARQRLGLLALLGFAPEAPVDLHPALRLGDDLMGRLGDTSPSDDPHLRSALAAYQVAEATLRLEVRRQYPDLRLGLGFENDRGDRSLGPVLGFSLPVWNANAQAIASADAARQAGLAEVAAAYAAALHDRAQARVVLADRRERLAAMESTLVPLIDAQLADTRRLAELGELDVALLLEVFDAAWNCKRDLVRLRADLGMAHNRLIALSLPAWMNVPGNTTADPSTEGKPHE